MTRHFAADSFQTACGKDRPVAGAVVLTAADLVRTSPSCRRCLRSLAYITACSRIELSTIR